MRTFARHIATAALLGMTVLGAVSTQAQEMTGTNFSITTPVITTGGVRSTSASYELYTSHGQLSSSESTSASFIGRGGFLHFPVATTPTLSGTAGNALVDLSWTASVGTLARVNDYQVGVATVSGGPYTFLSVGEVTSYTKTGLTNGTAYYIVVRAMGGTLALAQSNEITATPTTTTPPPPPSGGGGGGGGGSGDGGSGSVIISGLASPGASVTLLKDGAVAAISTADPGANWSITLASLSAGIYSFSSYASDIDGIKSSTVSFTQSITGGATTQVRNIFLSPTIGTSHSQIKQGETITFFGFTAPSSDVVLFVHSEGEFVERVTAAASGAWVKAFNSGFLEIGDHAGRSQSSRSDLLSTYSPTVAFKVGNQSILQTNECRRSDLNCDGKVNLTDFSILLFFWNQLNPQNARADINLSTKVDITDFSILLYDWTG